MGRQSARIYYQGLDHKEMVTWDGTKYQYHDKAYIWNSQTSSFELVWEKLYGLKLLYESLVPIKPVSSENNKYLYFAEERNQYIIYRIKINDKEPEPEEWYTSEEYGVFYAPKSSRGLGIHQKPRPYVTMNIEYRLLNLEDGTIFKSGVFNIYEELWAPSRVGDPGYVNEETTPAESGENHDYASIFTSYAAGATYQPINFIYFIAPTGISSLQLDNREGTDTFIIGRGIWDLGRLNDGTASGLLPRFLMLTWDNEFKILEIMQGSNMYSATVTSTPPFSPTGSPDCGGRYKFGVTRDGKLPVIDNTGRIWIVEVSGNSISYTDTGFDSDTGYWDVSPDYKYVMTFHYTGDSGGELKIWDMNTKKMLVNVSDEISSSNFFVNADCNFVGHKCIYFKGLHSNHGQLSYRYLLYKWR